MHLLKVAFESLIIAERILESVRVNISGDILFGLNGTFALIDLDNDGIIS